jgi:hypothetical protein
MRAQNLQIARQPAGEHRRVLCPRSFFEDFFDILFIENRKA